MHLLIGLLFLMLLKGCNRTQSSQIQQHGLVNDAVSITRTDNNAIISKDAINNIASEVGSLLKSNITAFNQKEAINTSEETNYCDVSGMKESLITNQAKSIYSTVAYNDCKEVENLQNGKINLNYMGTNEDDKCPECFIMKIEETYTFNELKLLKDVSLEGDVRYKEDGSIEHIEFKINGNVSYDNENYHLQNITQTIHY